MQSWARGLALPRRAKQCYARAPCESLCCALAAALLASPALRRHAGRQCQRHPGRRRRQAAALHGHADRRRRQGRCSSCTARCEARADTGHACRRRRPDPAARPDRRPWPCHGARLRRAAARPDRHHARSPTCSSGCAPMPPPIPTPRWILGRGWNQELWPDKRFPTAADLDAVVSDRPVVAGAGRRPCAGRQQRGAEARPASRRRPRRPPAAGSSMRGQSDRPVRRRRDATGRASDSRRRRAAEHDAGARPRRRSNHAVVRHHRRRPTWARSLDDWQAMRRAGEAGRLNVRIMSYACGIADDAGDRPARPDAVAVRRPAAAGRGQALRRRRARARAAPG